MSLIAVVGSVIALLVTTITLASGRSTVLHAAVHPILFGTSLFLAVVP